MRGLYLLLLLAFVVNVTALGQAAGDYRSATSGPWNQASTWEVLDPDLVTWNAAGVPPTAANTDFIQIISFTQVDVTTPVTADGIYIDGDAILLIGTGGTLTLSNGPAADDMLITQGDGFVTNDGFCIVSVGTTLTNQGVINSSPTNFLVDGTVIHSQNGGIIAIASWNAGSTLEIQGVTTGFPTLAPVPPAITPSQGMGPTGFLGQTFYNVRWNCTGQTFGIHLNAELTSITNNFDVVSTGNTGSASLLLTDASGPYDALNIGGNFTISGPSTVGAGVSTSGILYAINVTGDMAVSSTRATGLSMAGNSSLVGINVSGNFTKTGASAILMASTTVPVTVPVTPPQSTFATLDVDGNVTWTSGNLTMASGTNVGTPSHACVGRFNIGGNLTLTAGTWTENSNSSNGRGDIYFDDAKVHAYTSAVAVTGTTPFSNTINFFVPASSTLNMASNTAFTGLGTFNLSAGATLGVSSPQGLVNSTGAGHIRVGSFRIYTVGSNIVYNGTGIQNLGQEWSFTGALNGVAANLEIANSGGVLIDFTQLNTSVVGRLTLTSGAFDIGLSNTLMIQGDLVRTGGSITGHNNSNLTFAGSGTSTGNLVFTSGSEILNNFAINRSGSIPLGSDLTIHTSGILSFTNGGVLQLNGRTLTVNGDMTSVSGGLASNNVASNLVIGGSEALSVIPLCGSCGTNEFNNVTLSRGGTSPSYTWDGTANINGTIALNSGALTHQGGINMATNSTFSRAGGTTFTLVGSMGATTTYNVAYTGNLTTGPELSTISDNRLNNLTVGGTVTLDKAIRINGDVAINSGTLNATTHNVTMAGPTFAVNGGSFQIASTNTVTFSRAGTTALSGSTIGGSTFGNLTINSGATVSAPNASINISGTWLNNGTFQPNNGTVVFNGGTQTLNTNGQPFWNLITDAGTKTLVSNLNVDATLTITAGSTLDGSGLTIFVGDTWDNQGIYTFDATSVVEFDGTTQSIDGNGKPFGNVTFANGGTKTLATALDVDGNLTINSGVTLDTSPSNLAIALAGNWANNGTFTPNTGTITLDGSTTQFIGGTTNTQFRNIIQTNPSTVTMSSAQSLVNALTISAGIFNPNGNFTMLSTPTRDARINQLGLGASISATNMTIQRYMPNNASARATRYLASPVTNATAVGWKDDFPITGPFADHSTTAEWPGLPAFNATGASLSIYNEAHTPTANIDDRYEGYPTAASTLVAAPLVNGRGYAALVRQTTTLTIELVGRAAFGPVPVTVTNQAGGADDGYNLIGNPYPSPINWSNVSLPVDVSTTVSLKDNTNTIGLGAGQYVYFTQGGTGIPASYTGTIAQGQAFWVRKMTAGPTSITFQEDDKQPTAIPPFMRDSEENILRINVSGNGHQDEAIIAFNSNAKDIAEAARDAFKFTNDFVNLATFSADNMPLAINTMGSLECSRQIPISLTNVEPGSHVFTFSQLSSFTSGVDIRLLDTFTGETVAVNESNSNYIFDVTTDPKSFGKDRFKAFIGYKDVDLGLNVQAQAVCTGNDAQITVLSPQKGVAYFASSQGTTISDEVIATSSSDVTISIPKANLTASNSIITVMAKNKGCTALPLTNTTTLEIKDLPGTPAVTNASACGESSLTLNADGAPSGGSYRWYLTEDATDPIDGQTTSSFTTPSLAKTKTYFVSAVNMLGCEGARMAVTATVSYQDDATISVNGNTLVSSSATGNQWFLNDNPIAGATKQTFDAKESGTYKLVVTQGACTNAVAREFAVTGDLTKEGLQGYVLYPNPSPGVVYVEVATVSEVAVSITNAIGLEITRGELKQEGDRRKGQFDITGHANGVYLVIIKHDNQTVIKKIVKN